MKKRTNLTLSPFVLLTAMLCMTSYAPAQRTASVAVDAGTTYQHIDGFGGVGMSGQWAASYTQDKVDKLWGADGMGYNIMRIRIAPNENDWASYVPTVKWGKAHGITVFASPWTPPHRFKVGAEQTWGQSSNHGHINPDSIEVYAKWLEKFRQYMESQDAAIDIISIQNECDYDPEGYEGCLYTVEEITRMISAARKYINPKCKVMAPECFGWGSHTYNRELVKSAAVRNNTDIWGNHIYGANDLTYVGYVQNLTKKPMWMTEYIFDPDQVGNWDCGLNFAESIDNCLRHGFNAYIYYNMLDHFFGDGTGGGDQVFSCKIRLCHGTLCPIRHRTDTYQGRIHGQCFHSCQRHGIRQRKRRYRQRIRAQSFGKCRKTESQSAFRQPAGQCCCNQHLTQPFRAGCECILRKHTNARSGYHR